MITQKCPWKNWNRVVRGKYHTAYRSFEGKVPVKIASASGDRFDEENLITAFSYACKICNEPEEILDYLFDQVQQFIGGDRQNTDDMTLVVLQVK